MSSCSARGGRVHCKLLQVEILRLSRQILGQCKRKKMSRGGYCHLHLLNASKLMHGKTFMQTIQEEFSDCSKSRGGWSRKVKKGEKYENLKSVKKRWKVWKSEKCEKGDTLGSPPSPLPTLHRLRFKAAISTKHVRFSTHLGVTLITQSVASARQDLIPMRFNEDITKHVRFPIRSADIQLGWFSDYTVDYNLIKNSQVHTVEYNLTRNSVR